MIKNFIIIIIIITLIYLFMQKKKPNIYNTAYTLGINYLNNFDYNPRYTVMFDIDDTLLLDGAPNKPILKLLKECNKRKIKVVIITARSSIYTQETIFELEENDITFNKGKYHYNFIYLRHSPEDDHDLFKSNVKENLYNQGYLTIMSVGDQNVDIVGKYSGYGIKLPNKTDPRLFHINGLGKLENVSAS
jgi:hypothetical protein